MAMCRKFATMKSIEYHNKQIKYNMTGLLNEIAKKYPEDSNIDLNNKKYIAEIKNSAFNPMIMGGLATTLGIKDKVLTTELWEDLGNGWAPSTHSSIESIKELGINTPRGNLIQFAKTSTKIGTNGNYEYPNEDDKNKYRPGTEFLFVFGERFSTALALKATKDPSVEVEFKNMCQEVFEKKIVPEMTKLARIRTGKDGVNLQLAKEILVTSFMHSESRSEQPFYHFHYDLLNVALGYDGKFHTLDTDEIGKNIAAIDELFMSSMKEAIEAKWGYRLEPVYHEDDLKNEFLKDHQRKVVSFDLPKEVIPEDIQEWRKKRENEINEFLQKEKLAGRDAYEIARLETRMEKTDLSPSELRAKWKSEFNAMGWTEEQLDAAIKSYQPKEKIRPTMEEMNDSFFRNHKDVAFTEYQYIAHVSKQLLPFMSADEAKRIATKEFEENCVQALTTISEKGKPSQKDFFKDFLNGKITDPVEYQSMQLKYMREVKFLHKSIIEQEKYVMDSLKARDMEQQFVIFDKKQAQSFIYEFEKQKGFNLTTGQKESIKMILTEPGAVCNVSGRAGAGKSTLLEATKQALEAKDFNIWGISTSGAATKSLAQSTNMADGKYHNTTVFKMMLDSGKIKLNNKSIIFWDEAGMADSKTYYDVVKKANEAGAKLVLVGESEQLQSVGHGGLFRKFTEDFKTTKVSEISRQKDQWQREVVEGFATGNAANSVSTLYKEDKVFITKTDKERQDLLVNRYLTETDSKVKIKTDFVEIKYLDHNQREQSLKVDKIETLGKTFRGKEIIEVLTNKEIMNDDKSKSLIEEKLNTKFAEIKSVVQIEMVDPNSRLSTKDKIILASKNEDVNLLNEKVRAGLKAQGKLQGEVAKVLCRDGEVREFAIGDRIIMTKTQKTNDFDAKKLNNSEIGEVIGFGRTASKSIRTLQIKMDDGQVIFLDAKKELNVNHGYASTVHKSQGQTKDKGYFYVTNLVDMHTAYVACSRHRHDLTLYFSTECNNQIAKEMADKVPTKAMLKTAEWVAKEKNVEFKAEWKESFLQTRDFLNTHHYDIPGVDKTQAALDDIKSIIHAMGQSNYKKTTFDFEIQDGKIATTHSELVVKEIEAQKLIRARAEDYKAVEKDAFRATVSKVKNTYRKEVKEQNYKQDLSSDAIVVSKSSKAFTGKPANKTQIKPVAEGITKKPYIPYKKFTSDDFKKQKPIQTEKQAIKPIAM